MRKLNTKDCFQLARMIKELDLKEFIKGITSEAGEALTGKEVDDKQLESIGMDLFMSVIEKVSDENCEEALYKFLSGPFEVTPNEVGEMDPLTLLESLMNIADVGRWKDFLKLAIR